jgi:Ca-activated chloride channel homolog
MAHGLRVAAAMTILAGSVLVGAEQTFRSGVDLVRLPVIVLDRAGVPIEGLKAEDFEVKDGGRTRPITFFAAGATGAEVPLHLALMFDTSESMEKELDLATRLGVGLVDGIPEAVDVTLVEFDATVRISRYEPPSYSRLVERLRRRDLGRRTVLFDALGRYVALAAERPGQHVVVVCTDGDDSSLSLGPADARDLVRIGDVLVYMVGHLGQYSGTTRARLQGLLSTLSQETGGEAFFLDAARDVPGIVSKIRSEIQGRYTIGYERPIAELNERFRKVQVQLKRPDLSRAKVRTRSGYVVR